MIRSGRHLKLAAGSESNRMTASAGGGNVSAVSSLPEAAETPTLAELERRSELALREMTVALDAVEQAMFGKPVR